LKKARRSIETLDTDTHVHFRGLNGRCPISDGDQVVTA